MGSHSFALRLAVVQFFAAGTLGAIGLIERSRILDKPFFGDQMLRDSTAAYHVWPWPFKLAVVANIPAFLGNLLLSFILPAQIDKLPEWWQLSPGLLFVAFTWYWIGIRLERMQHRNLMLIAFTGFACAGALLPLGYVGFAPYGLVLWVVFLGVLARKSRS